MSKYTPTPRRERVREYPGDLDILLVHKRPTDEGLRLLRAHEQRRLKAYLRGDTQFTHGYHRIGLMRYPLVFPVVPENFDTDGFTEPAEPTA